MPCPLQLSSDTCSSEDNLLETCPSSSVAVSAASSFLSSDPSARSAHLKNRPGVFCCNIIGCSLGVRLLREDIVTHCFLVQVLRDDHFGKADRCPNEVIYSVSQ